MPWRKRTSGDDVLRYLRALRASSSRARNLPYVDPLRAGRHPFQTYLLTLGFVSGLPYLFGEATAQAIEDHLPAPLALAWGLSLVFGTALALVGAHWRGAYDIALTLERAGLYVTGFAGVGYGLVVLGSRDHFAPLLGAGILLGLLAIRVPVWVADPRRRKAAEDTLSVLGVVSLVVCSALLLLSPAREVLVGGAIIVGFGISCLKRARDIAVIFDRARRGTISATILREGQT